MGEFVVYCIAFLVLAGAVDASVKSSSRSKKKRK